MYFMTHSRSAKSVGGRKLTTRGFLAAMMVHGVKRILTFNVGDFRRYQAIEVLDPREV